MKITSKLLFWNIVFTVSIPFCAISLVLFLHQLFNRSIPNDPIKILSIIIFGFGFFYGTAIMFISEYFTTALIKRLEKNYVKNYV